MDSKNTYALKTIAINKTGLYPSFVAKMAPVGIKTACSASNVDENHAASLDLIPIYDMMYGFILPKIEYSINTRHLTHSVKITKGEMIKEAAKNTKYAPKRKPYHCSNADNKEQRPKRITNLEMNVRQDLKQMCMAH